MQEITSLSEFEKHKKNQLLIIDFYAHWCGPCKAISPVFEQLATKHEKPGSIVFAKVNVDDAKDVSRVCGITAMPTFQFYVKGSKVDEVRGADRQSLSNKITQYVAIAAKTSSASGTKLGASQTFQGSAPIPGGLSTLKSLVNVDQCKLVNGSSRSSVKSLVRPSFAGASVDSAPGARLLIHVPFTQAINAACLRITVAKDAMPQAPSALHVGTNVEDPKDLNSLARAENVQSFTLYTDDYSNGLAEVKFKTAKFQGVKSLTILIDANISQDSEQATKLSQIDFLGTKV